MLTTQLLQFVVEIATPIDNHKPVYCSARDRADTTAPPEPIPSLAVLN